MCILLELDYEKFGVLTHFSFQKFSKKNIFFFFFLGGGGEGVDLDLIRV